MNNKKLLGKIPPVILIIGGVVVVVVVMVIFFIISQQTTPPPPPEEPEPKGPVTELKYKDIKVILVKTEDIGNILFGADSNYFGKKDVTTTEKFIKVTVTAENTGKEETKSGDWDIGEIIDSEGRKFPYFNKLDAWLPTGNECRKNLKPGFTPIFCTKIYEVAKISKDMKIKIKFKDAILDAENFIDLIGI